VIALFEFVTDPFSLVSRLTQRGALSLRYGIKWPKRLEYILFDIKITTYYKIKQFNIFESQSIILLLLHLLCKFTYTCNEILIFKYTKLVLALVPTSAT
jgi:hypothetical protein